jgi:hypothetical protein
MIPSGVHMACRRPLCYVKTCSKYTSVPRLSVLWFLAGKREGSHQSWEYLCLDVRRLILSKVPDLDLALAASTCQEFRDESRKRAQDIRTTATSVANETYGKMLPGFLRAVRRSACGLTPYSGLSHTGRRYLVINRDGKQDLLAVGEFSERRSINMTYIQRCGYSSDVTAELEPRDAVSGKAASLRVHVYGHSQGSVQLDAFFSKEAAVPVLGVLLGICKGYSKTRQARRGGVPHSICLSIKGLMDDSAGQREMRKLFDPLKSLVKSLVYEYPEVYTIADVIALFLMM